jgi:hypothetical protein
LLLATALIKSTRAEAAPEIIDLGAYEDPEEEDQEGGMMLMVLLFALNKGILSESLLALFGLLCYWP